MSHIPVVEVNNLYKTYGTTVAVDNVSFSIPKGHIFALLGPNGAGKTTTLECLEGLRVSDSGSISILGFDPKTQHKQVMRKIGVQLQSSGLPPTIIVEEAINFFAAYHQVAADKSIIARLGLQEKRKVQFQGLSTGQKRRLALALAVLHKPEIVFLDEPTAGLDVSSRRQLHEMMQELRQQGATFLLSSHDMAEVEAMADQVAILINGRLVLQGTPQEITAGGEGLTRISVRTTKGTLDISPPYVVREDIREGYSVFLQLTPLKLCRLFWLTLKKADTSWRTYG